jgi:hypothetical protein
MRGTFEVSEQVQRSILLWAAGCITTAAASSSPFRKAFSIVLICARRIFEAGLGNPGYVFFHGF